MLKKLAIFVIVIFGFSYFTSIYAEKSALPSRDIIYQNPTSDVPESIRLLLGKWEGDWDGKLNSYLIVEKVTREKAHIAYGTGTYAPWKYNKRWNSRSIAYISTDNNQTILKFKFPNSKKPLTARLSEDGKTLVGQYKSSSITMFKSAEPDFKSQVTAYITSKNRIVAFVNVNVVTMIDEKTVPSQTVVVQDGKINQIGRVDQIMVPESAKKIDGKGSAYLMPGLADMHIHLTKSHYLRLLIANGVTTIRNMWGMDRHLIFKEDIKNKQRVGPMIYSTGPLLDGDPPIWRGSTVIKTVEEAKQIVKETSERGFDFVKVYNRLNKESYEAIIDTAKVYGLPVVGHVPLAIGFEAALEAGQYSFEHLEGSIYASKNGQPHNSRSRNWGLELDEIKLAQYLEKTVKAGVWNCPTLVVFKSGEQNIESLLNQPEMKYISKSRKMWWGSRYWNSPKEYRDKRTYLVKRLHKAGANLLLGTDFPNPYVIPGFSIHEELERLVECGLTPYEAIKTGTYNAAKFMKKLDLFGTVEVGKKADFILLKSNPLDNVANIKKTLGVMANGIWYPKSALDKMLEDVEKEVAASDNT